MMINKITTKEAIMLSLEELMKQKSLDKISVTDICDNCGIQRQMFYYYFRDKYAVVNYMFYSSQIETMRASLDKYNWNETIVLSSEKILGNKNYYINAFKSNDMNSLSSYLFNFTLMTVRSVILSQLPEHRLDSTQELIIRQYVHGIVGILKEWYINNSMKEPTELIAISIIENIPELFKPYFQDVKPEYLDFIFNDINI